ncbi:helix-turn-helix domain-containing protein [Marinilactibacillus psychrotolerans]|uniref:helix-turn-helix domain-containing protein n=1 Tax=Marinilactibacillus psychrotolerans TaxID=191770 RepID=UPI0039B0ADD3
MEFSDRIKQLRVDKGYSQTGLAKELYVTRQAVSKWERGAGKPDHEVLKQISNFFNISLDDLLNQDDAFPCTATFEASQSDSIPSNNSFNRSDVSENPNTYKRNSPFKSCKEFLKIINFHFIALFLIALFPIVLDPAFLLISFPMAILALRYKRKNLFYAVAVVATLLLITLTAYGYLGSKFGWFTNVEVIPIESEMPVENEPSPEIILEKIEK